MSLVSRLVNPDYGAGETKLPIYAFMGRLGRAVRGEEEISAAQDCAKLALSAGEKTAMQAMYTAAYSSLQNGHGVVITLELIRDTLLAGECGCLTEQEILASITAQ